jgi:hypothetical protein
MIGPVTFEQRFEFPGGVWMRPYTISTMAPCPECGVAMKGHCVMGVCCQYSCPSEVCWYRTLARLARRYNNAS